MWIAAWVAVGVGIALMIEAMVDGDIVVEEGPRSAVVRGAVLLAAGLGLLLVVLMGDRAPMPMVANTVPIGAVVASGMVLAAGVVAVFSEDRRMSIVRRIGKEPLALRPRFRAMTRLERLREDGEYPSRRKSESQES